MNPEEKLHPSEEEAWKRDERSWEQILEHFEGLSDEELEQVTCFQFPANWWDEQRCQRVTLRQTLREGQVNSLVTVLNKMPQLQHLDVRFSKIGVQGARALAAAKMPQLQHLHVSRHEIGDQGVKAFAKATLLCPRVWKVVDFGLKSSIELCELLEADLPPRLAGKANEEVLEYLHCRISAQVFLSCYAVAEKRRLNKDMGVEQLSGMDTFSRSSIHEPKLVPLILAYLKGSTKPTGH